MESENLEDAQEADTRERLLKKYAAKSIRIKTRHDYESRLRLYLASGRRLPATDVEIVEYIESAKVMSRKKNGEYITKGSLLAVSSVQSIVAALSWWHQENNHQDPTNSALVKKAIAAIKRERAKPQAQARAIKTEEIAAITETLLELQTNQNAADSLRAVRDLAFILALFYTGCRESEIRHIQVDDLEFTDDGLIVKIRKSKTDDGAGRNTPIPYRDANGQKILAAYAISDWIEKAGIKSGFVFRTVDQYAVVGRGKKPLDYGFSSRTLLKYAEMSGVSTDGISTHSFRAGCATALNLSGAGIAEIAQHLGHRSTASTMRYLRADASTRLKDAPTRKIAQTKKTLRQMFFTFIARLFSHQ